MPVNFLEMHYYEFLAVYDAVCVVLLAWMIARAFQPKHPFVLSMLPFAWVFAAAIALFQLAIFGPVDINRGDAFSAIWSIVVGLIHSWISWRLYRMWKNSDDDTWKKRRRRIVEKIQQIEGRLVPVPA